MPESLTTSSFTSPTRPSRHFSYLTAGPPTAPLLIFIHGWPGLSLTWRPQLLTFAGLGFRVGAMDTLGYGHSTASKNDGDYSCEHLAKDQIEFLEHLSSSAGGGDGSAVKEGKAVWTAHDWGSGILWTLAAHYPHRCAGIVNLCVPYRMLELGLDVLKTTISRDIYSESEYPSGPWAYQDYYEKHRHDGATKELDALGAKGIKLLFAKGNQGSRGKPARTAAVKPETGWYGLLGGPDPEKVMDLPLSYTVFDGEEDIFDAVMDSMKRNTYFGPTAYYLNHKVNAAYNEEERCPTKAVLEMPVLFVDALFDGVCTESGAKGLYEPMRKKCKDLREVEIEAGHWVNMEKPREVNSAMAKWLVGRVSGWWPRDQEKTSGRERKL